MNVNNQFDKIKFIFYNYEIKMTKNENKKFDYFEFNNSD